MHVDAAAALELGAQPAALQLRHAERGAEELHDAGEVLVPRSGPRHIVVRENGRLRVPVFACEEGSNTTTLIPANASCLA